MSKQTFTANTILTAAQMNTLQANDYNQTVSTKTANYVLVASDVGTKIVMNAAGATSITVNTSLFTAGDNLTIANIGAGVCTVTAGTATVSSAGPLAISQYGGGTLYFTSAGVSTFFGSAGPAASSGLTKISSGTASAAIRIDFTNVFSATYKNYRVILSNISNVTDNEQFYILFGTSGTPLAMGASYVSANVRSYSSTTLNSIRQASNFYLNGNMGTINNFAVFDIFNPQVAKYTMLKASSLGTYTAQVFVTNEIYGQVQTTTQYTDMFFEGANATNVGALDYAIYGYEA